MTMIHSSAIIEPGAKIGNNVSIGAFSYIGADVEIGDNTIVASHVVIEGHTKIGSENHIYQFASIGACELGSNIVFANCASLAGHVKVEDFVIMGGFSLVHQFCRVGAHCITGIGSVCIQDVPPFMLAAGNKAKAYKIIYRSGLTTKSAIEEIRKQEWTTTHIEYLTEFFDSSQRGVIR